MTAVTRFVCLSDTHTMHDRISVPDGDVLLHAGDFTGRGTVAECVRFAAWFMAQPHRHKAIIAGNHDLALEQDPALGAALFGEAYLFESAAEFDGLRVWGAPWQPEFCNWAFNLQRGEALRAKWRMIPDGTDVVLTHGPPAGALDRTSANLAVGCADLRAELRRVRPRMHVFGHIHEGYGTGYRAGTTFVNASVCTAAYQPVNQPIVVDI